MYVLNGNMWQRGFNLSDENGLIFKTKHSLGFLSSSSVIIGDESLKIKGWGDACEIIKDGSKIGDLTLNREPYSIISLNRKDGSVDFFKLAVGLSEYNLYSVDENPLLKFRQAWTANIFFNKFEIDILSHVYPNSILEELIFYTGEIIYRRVWTVMWAD